MIKKVTFPAALVVAALACASLAQAESSPAAATGTKAAPAQMMPSSPATKTAGTLSAKPSLHYVVISDRVTSKDIAAFHASRVTLDQAIATAESETHGKAVEAAFRSGRHGPRYVVTVMRHMEVSKVFVNADSGKIAYVARNITLRRLYPYERSDFVMTKKAKSGLANAVAIAAETSNEKPIAAMLVRAEGMSTYHVAIVGSDGLRTVWVSPNNPAIVASK